MITTHLQRVWVDTSVIMLSFSCTFGDILNLEQARIVCDGDWLDVFNSSLIKKLTTKQIKTFKANIRRIRKCCTNTCGIKQTKEQQIVESIVTEPIIPEYKVYMENSHNYRFDLDFD